MCLIIKLITEAVVNRILISNRNGPYIAPNKIVIFILKFSIRHKHYPIKLFLALARSHWHIYGFIVFVLVCSLKVGHVTFVVLMLMVEEC